MAVNEIILKMENISKFFPGVRALSDVNFDLRKGEVHALLGENGAGKSTLMKCLAGIYPIDQGTIEFFGQIIHIRNPMDSIKHGISVIHQELALAEQLTVADNIYMGQEPLGKAGLIDRKKINQECTALLKSISANFNSQDRVFSLSTAQKQMLEIAKAINKQCSVLVMDEPTAAVSQREVDAIFDMIRLLKQKGMSIVYISHRMDEIFRIADRITVLRDGKRVDTVDVGTITRDELVRMMVGYNLDRYYTRSKNVIGDTVLEVSNLTRKDGRVKNISFHLCRGEIVGFAGLVGSGRTEVIEALFGLSDCSSGKIMVKGIQCKIRRVHDALKAGLCLVPEDRKLEGLILGNTVLFNMSISILEKFIRIISVDKKKEISIAQNFVDKLSIKISSLLQRTGNLSGGNQQKIVLSKWLSTDSDILMFDEPTRGIDIGAKAEIYALMDRLVSSGKSIIMVSSELPEVINMSDRIYIMRDGEIKTCFDDKQKFDQEEILRFALGVI